MKRSLLFVTTVLAACALQAETTFDLTYSGAEFGNGATATGSITFSDGFPDNPSGGAPYMAAGPEIISISLTISGATSGNGTFTAADFGLVIWSTDGGTLDFGAELVNQATGGGLWGVDRGDFNLFASTPTAPDGVSSFVLGAEAGSGDPMKLTSMVVVPEPQTVVFVGLGLLALVAGRRLQKR